LVLHGYINPLYEFDLVTATNISPFLGNFIAPFVTLASALLVLENLKEVRMSNAILLENLNEVKAYNQLTIYKYKREITLKQCQVYLIDIQADIKVISEKGFPGNAHMFSDYLREPLTSEQIVNNSTFKSHIELYVVDEKLHAFIVLHFSKLESFSAYFLHGDLDLELGKAIISKYFLKQIHAYLPFIAYYRNEEETTYCNNILELYKLWGGVIKI
jgi:hypothetical protein